MRKRISTGSAYLYVDFDVLVGRRRAVAVRPEGGAISFMSEGSIGFTRSADCDGLIAFAAIIQRTAAF
jgi:hypothetical protein